MWEGFCIDMLEELAKRLQFNYVIHSSLDGNWGAKSNETQEWSGMMREIIDGVGDLWLWGGAFVKRGGHCTV